MRFGIGDKVQYTRKDASLPLVQDGVYTVKGAYCFQRDEYLHLLEVKNETGDPFLADGFNLIKRGKPMSPETKQILTDLATALCKYADEERTLASDNLDDTRKFLKHSSAASGFMRAVYYITDELLSPARQEKEVYVEKWGIWNKKKKRFVFGIKEPSQNLAREKFLKIAPRATHDLPHYEERLIPEGFVNPPNPNTDSYGNESGW